MGSAGSMARQLVFDLTRTPCFDAEDFLVSEANAAAVAAVRAWRDWPGRTLLLIGPPGAGKSHLAAVWAGETGAIVLRDGRTPSPSLWDGGGRCVLLEDCDRAGYPEPAFFHAINLARETRGWLMMTARTPPTHWRVATPDLRSRLRLATLATIAPPDAELVKAVLLKLFADRQIDVDEDVVTYASRHCDQSLEAVAHFVSAIDEASLAAGRRITRPLAAKVLAGLQIESLSDQDHGPT